MYQLEGKNLVCNEGDVKCIPGLSIDERGKVKMNGSKGKVTVNAAVKLQPWPFVEGMTVPNHILDRFKVGVFNMNELITKGLNIPSIEADSVPFILRQENYTYCWIVATAIIVVSELWKLWIEHRREPPPSATYQASSKETKPNSLSLDPLRPGYLKGTSTISAKETTPTLNSSSKTKLIKQMEDKKLIDVTTTTISATPPIETNNQMKLHVANLSKTVFPKCSEEDMENLLYHIPIKPASNQKLAIQQEDANKRMRIKEILKRVTWNEEDFLDVNIGLETFDMITEQVATRTTAAVERPPSPRTFEHAATINTGTSLAVLRVPILDARRNAAVERPPSRRTFEHATTINTGTSLAVLQVPILDARRNSAVEIPPSRRTFEHAATISNTGILSLPVLQLPIPDPVVVEPEQCYQILTTFRSMHLPSLAGLS